MLKRKECKHCEPCHKPCLRNGKDACCKEKHCPCPPKPKCVGCEVGGDQDESGCDICKAVRPRHIVTNRRGYTTKKCDMFTAMYPNNTCEKCIKCPFGMVINMHGTDCVRCPYGHITTADQTGCVKCKGTTRIANQITNKCDLCTNPDKPYAY